MKTGRSKTRANGPASLRGLRIGISGAVPEREHWGTVTDLDQVILRFVSQLSALIIKYGGEVVHGSHPSFTPVVMSQARAFSRGRAERRAVTLITSKLWDEYGEIVTRASGVANVILTPRVGGGDSADQQTRNDSLTALRLTLAGCVDVLVAIGGKLHRDTGYNPGVLEELAIARWRGVPCFVVASYRGLAGTLESEVIRRFSGENGMDEATSDAMASWGDDVEKFVGKLVEHLIESRDRLVRPQEVPSKVRSRTVGAGFNDSVVEAMVDLDLVLKSAGRFAELREALKTKDVVRVAGLLGAPP